MKKPKRKTTKSLGEFELIKKMSAKAFSNDSVLLGIGDDAAEIKLQDGHNLLVTTDLLVEDVHFRIGNTTARELGHKAMAVNLSDIAAMGAKPLAAFVSVAIPKHISNNFCINLFNGMNALAEKHQTAIAGGDTTSSTDKLVINITLTGQALKGKSLTRKNAKAGNELYLVGDVGLSRAGLESLENGLKASEKLRQAHKCPEPLINEGLRLSQSGSCTACIDVSDGLLGDLSHILEQSVLAAEIELDKIPVTKELKRFASYNKVKTSDYLLNGGEDYALLFCVKDENFLKDWPKTLKQPVKIGRLKKGEGITLLDENGKIIDEVQAGFDHFKGS